MITAGSDCALRVEVEHEITTGAERAVIDASLAMYEATIAMDTFIDATVARLYTAEAEWGAAVRALLAEREL
jgi:hypothetical protein